LAKLAYLPARIRGLCRVRNAAAAAKDFHRHCPLAVPSPRLLRVFAGGFQPGADLALPAVLLLLCVPGVPAARRPGSGIRLLLPLVAVRVHVRRLRVGSRVLFRPPFLPHRPGTRLPMDDGALCAGRSQCLARSLRWPVARLLWSARALE